MTEKSPLGETAIPMQRWGRGWITSKPYFVAQTGPHQIIVQPLEGGFVVHVLPLDGSAA